MSKRKICIVTGSRAEYGHLYWLLRAIEDDSGLILQLVVTGMHLSREFGSTVKIIEKDGFKINARVNVLSSSGKEWSVSRSIGAGVEGCADVFKKLKPDIIVVLGDRYEIFAAAIAAYVLHIPIAHIHGGELTQGALDEAFRHSITKMSSIHFPSIQAYADRIVRMGEPPARVFAFGSPGLDNMKRLRLLAKQELEKSLGLVMNKTTAVVTYHPVTLEKNSVSRQMDELLCALDRFDMNIVFTSPNSDPGYKTIINKIRKYVTSKSARVRIFDSLGQLNYLSLLKYADIMVGNSSSGIIEAPSFKLPVVNIGDRQKGRIQAANVINCGYAAKDIEKAIRKGLKPSFRKSLEKLSNPYGDGETSLRIKHRLKKIKLGDELLKKEFFDG